jgi:3-methyladenine DNA glycosylase AlkD
MKLEEIIRKLKSLENPKNIQGMARFGIKPKTKVLGISVPELRKMAKRIGKNHKLGLELWNSRIHEARLLAIFISDAESFTEKQIEKWVKDFDSWDITDQACMNLFYKNKIACKKIADFAKRSREFEKRTAFSLIACVAFKNKSLKNKDFEKFFDLIRKASNDERNFVKKAINWALRQIGKRNKNLNKKSVKIAKEVSKMKEKSAKWIANNALSELQSEAVQKRLQHKKFL